RSRHILTIQPWNDAVRLHKVGKIRVVESGGIPGQPNLRLGQLPGVLVIGRRVAAAESGFSKGSVTDFAIKCPIGVGGDGGGIDLIAQDPVEGGRAVADCFFGNGLAITKLI
ncbi:MAG: hypothetical protein P4L50_28430, partial [Anaerolineaceae bacterium]|nr:hypothetical protein [Anaerolineaceae bacterium]